MKKIFQEILNMDGIHGIILLSSEGKILFESLDKNRFSPGRSRLTWTTLVESLDDFAEVDLVFKEGRFYIRSTGTGYLMISMSEKVSMAMVKLSCDIILPEIAKQTSAKGLRGFFKR